MCNFFETLNESLQSENLLNTWQLLFEPIHRNETFAYHHDDGSRHGRRISIYRDQDGRYERPVHYSCN